MTSEVFCFNKVVRPELVVESVETEPHALAGCAA